MNSRPLVGIGMPVYNGGRFLSVAIESLLAQDLRDFELVISDNASTDDTEHVCRAYAARDPRIRYVRQPRNLGANPNFNIVRWLARGTYFKWASANDRCAPSLLRECVRVLEERPDVVLCYPRTRLIDEDDRPIEDYDDKLLLEDDDPVSRFINVVEQLALNNAFNGVVRSGVLAAVGVMRTYLGSDLPLMAALALRGKFHQLPEYLFFRRIGPASHSSVRHRQHNTDDYLFDEVDTLLKQHLDYFGTVLRAPIQFGQKARLLGFLLHRLAWDRAVVFRELRHALASKALRGNARHPSSPPSVRT